MDKRVVLQSTQNKRFLLLIVFPEIIQNASLVQSLTQLANDLHCSCYVNACAESLMIYNCGVLIDTYLYTQEADNDMR